MILPKTKLIYVLLVFLMLSADLYSQKEYSVSAGSNYTIVSKYGDNGKFGFHLNGNVEFTINKHISITTGLGVKQLNLKTKGISRSSEMTYFTGTNVESEYDDRQPFVIPGAVVVVGDSIYNVNNDPITIDSLGNLHTYWSNGANLISSFSLSNYKLIILNLPIQIQFSLLKNKLELSYGVSISSVIYAKSYTDSKWINPEATSFGNNVSYNANNLSYNANSEFKSAFVNVNIGAKYKLFKNFFAGFEYERSISNISKLYSSTYLNNISVNLTYKLNK